MSYRDTVLFTALLEAEKPVHWKSHENRILEYFTVSSGISYTKSLALEVSWCSYFVHWCLFKGGMKVLLKVGTASQLGKMGSIGRFVKSYGGVYQNYGVFRRNYHPKPGDMHHRPIIILVLYQMYVSCLIKLLKSKQLMEIQDQWLFHLFLIRVMEEKSAMASFINRPIGESLLQIVLI